jgi:hypothetical protein
VSRAVGDKRGQVTGRPGKSGVSETAHIPLLGRRQVSRAARFPSVSSQNKAVKVNADGSVDVYFGPKAPAGQESNWVQTVPGKSWFTILRLYGPLEPWFRKEWRPDDIVLLP